MGGFINTAVFVFSGYLESGKTTAIQNILFKKTSDEKVVIICTEKGEINYDEERLFKNNVVVVYVDEESKLDYEFLYDIKDDYNPDTVYVEFNGLWDLKKFTEGSLPDDWYVAEVFAVADGSVYESYLKTMRSTVMKPFTLADVIMFNRCGESFPKEVVRSSIKILNGSAEVFFTRTDGSIDNSFKDYETQDLNGLIDIEENMFCQWFVDCMENTDKYLEKRVRFKAMVKAVDGLMDNQFYFGRYVIICSFEYTKFIGFITEMEEECLFEGFENELAKLDDGDFVVVEGRITAGEFDGNKRIILLKADKIKKLLKPKEKFLFF